MRALCGLRLGLLLLIFVSARTTTLGQSPLAEGLYAEIGTPHGAITCQLFYDRAPLTTASFVGLAEGTLGPKTRQPFFNGLRFHRVVPDFVVQGGDPLGTGEGGPGYSFPDEFVPGLRHDAAGVLSMANDGPDTNGSQFFLTLRETNRLNYLHSVFGRVVKGLEVLSRIEQGDAMTVKILRVGRGAEAFRPDDSKFSAMIQKAKTYAKFAAAKPAPASDAHFHDPDGLLPSDPPRAKNFNFKLANLERATGVRIVGRMFARSPSAAEDEKPGAFMRVLAEKLGTAQRGALAVYFADENDWRVWIGDDLTAKFVGQRGTAAEFTRSGRMHEVKEIFLQEAEARADAEFARQQKNSPSNQKPPPNQRLKLHTDAILDGLIIKLEL